jgi:uncharacterized protein
VDLLAQFPQHSPGIWIAILVAIVFAGVAHGAIGFGFPLISTPLVALITDVRTAVLTTLLPNIVLNVISVLRGTQRFETLRRFWPVAAYVLVGALIGTQVLTYADPKALKLLLTVLITGYLLQSRIAGSARGPLHEHPHLGPAVFGLTAGFFSGTVNVAVPPLLIYFSALELAPIVMTQAMNLSFLVGRATQTVALAASGQMGLGLVLLSVPLSVISVLALAVGFRVQPHIPPQTLARLLRAVLWTMATILLVQALKGYLA